MAWKSLLNYNKQDQLAQGFTCDNWVIEQERMGVNIKIELKLWYNQDSRIFGNEY